MEKQTQKTDLWTRWGGEKERVRCMERVPWKHILPYVKQTANGKLLCVSGSSSRSSVEAWRGGMGREMGGRFEKEGTYAYL